VNNQLILREGEKITIDNELIDNLLKDYKKPEDLIGEKWAVEAADEAVAGAGDGCGADRSRL
jgi:hypothetical protein